MGAVALLCCELLQSSHRAERTLSLACKRRRQDVNLDRKSNILRQIFFFSRSCSNRRRYRSPATLFLSPGPRTAADWFLLQGMPINNASCARKRPYHYLVDCCSRHTKNSCIQFCVHEHFVVGNGPCLLFDICLLLVGSCMNRLYLHRLFFLFLHECTLFSANYVGQSVFYPQFI